VVSLYTNLKGDFMSEENLVNVEVKENKCFYQSQGFRNFLIVALGNFVGVYFALSLFCAIHKPPMMQMGGGFPPAPYMMKHHGDFDCPCHKKHKGDMKKIKHHEEFKENVEHKDLEDKD